MPARARALAPLLAVWPTAVAPEATDADLALVGSDCGVEEPPERPPPAGGDSPAGGVAPPPLGGLSCPPPVPVPVPPGSVEPVPGSLGVDTVTPGVVAVTPGVGTPTLGADTVTPGTDTPTPGTDTPTLGTDTPMPGTEIPTPGSESPAAVAPGAGRAWLPVNTPAPTPRSAMRTVSTRRGKGRDGLLARVIQRDHTVDPCDLEDPQHPLVLLGADRRERPATAFLHTHRSPHEHADRR